MNPKLESRGRHTTETVVRGAGRAISELPKYRLELPTKAFYEGRLEEACPPAAEFAFAWFALE